MTDQEMLELIMDRAGCVDWRHHQLLEELDRIHDFFGDNNSERYRMHERTISDLKLVLGTLQQMFNIWVERKPSCGSSSS